jgi:hypothetical protein
MTPARLAAVLPALAAPSPSLTAALVVALLLSAAALVAAVRFVVRRRRGPLPLARVLLVGSLYEANLPRSRRRGED